VKIKVNEFETHWTCGDGCCDNFETVSIFHYGGKEYEYRSHDAEHNLTQFLAEVLGLEFEIEYTFGEVTI